MAPDTTPDPSTPLDPLAKPFAATHVLATGETEVLQVLEERAHVEKRLVETDHARIHVSVEEFDEPVEALLTRQDLVIDRVPRGIRIDAVPAVRRDGDTVVVPVVEEVLVVEKRLMLREELHIRIDVTKQRETQTVRLRREHVDIERGPVTALDPNPRSTS